MPILQKKIRSDFTTVHNAFLRDKTFGINARGLLITMLSMADGWNFSIKGLASILPNGEYRVASTLRELEKFGYLKRNRICDEKGRVRDWEYCFSDEPIYLEKNQEPHRENQDVVFQDVDNSDVEKPVVENRDDYKISNNQIPKDQISMEESINQSIGSAVDKIDRIDEREKYRSLVENNIGYDWYVENAPKDFVIRLKLERVNELVEIILDVICSRKKSFRINQENMSKEVVKSTFLKLRNEHIEYVLASLERITSEVGNPRAYTISALYNSLQTANINEYMQTDFSDLY